MVERTIVAVDGNAELVGDDTGQGGNVVGASSQTDARASDLFYALQ